MNFARPARFRDCEMKTVAYITIVMLLILPTLSVTAWAAAKSPETEVPTFVDNDGDGVNDAFRDSDGDGVNDVTGKTYLHRFEFKDDDGDGNNDLFRDANGDGLNDLIASGNLKPGNPGYLHYIDYDDDGVNDVTGEAMRGPLSHVFIDEDGDGINDAAMPGMQGRGHGMMGRNSDRDEFMDEDRDGINDGRGFERYQRRQGRRHSDDTTQNRGQNR